MLPCSTWWPLSPGWINLLLPESPSWCLNPHWTSWPRVHCLYHFAQRTLSTPNHKWTLLDFLSQSETCGLDDSLRQRQNYPPKPAGLSGLDVAGNHMGTHVRQRRCIEQLLCATHHARYWGSGGESHNPGLQGIHSLGRETETSTENFTSVWWYKCPPIIMLI